MFLPSTAPDITMAQWLRKPVLRFLHGAVHDSSITGLNDRCFSHCSRFKFYLYIRCPCFLSTTRVCPYNKPPCPPFVWVLSTTSKYPKVSKSTTDTPSEGRFPVLPRSTGWSPLTKPAPQQRVADCLDSRRVEDEVDPAWYEQLTSYFSS